MASFIIRAALPEDRAALAAMTIRHWGNLQIEYDDGFIDVADLPAFVAVEDGAMIGSLIWRLTADHSLQIVTLASDKPRRGVGSALLAAAEQEAQKRSIFSVTLSTDNSNLDALRLYQKQGYVLQAIKRDVFTRLRLQKPEIPEINDDNGLPIRDQLDLVKTLD